MTSKGEKSMKSLEALKDLFNEANRLQGAKYKFTTDELFTRYDVIKKDLEILEIFKNNDYYVVEDEGLYRITFSLHDYDLDDFTYWKNENRKKTLF